MAHSFHPSFVHPLVTTAWLADNLANPKLVLLDASMVEVLGREPIVYNQPVYIPGSRKMDLESNFCDLNSTMVHAFPSAEQFTEEAQKLGINSDSTVVIYDNQGIYSAPRAWWMFQAMGHINTFVVDGGLPQWLAENRETVAGLTANDHGTGNLRSEFHPEMVCGANDLLTALQAGQVSIVDARSPKRFYGTAPEPRAGVRSGHIPGSQNLPFAKVLDEHTFKNPERLKALFADILPASGQQAVFSCGSGITACILLLAAVIAGYKNNALYDGSWADWGSNPELLIE